MPGGMTPAMMKARLMPGRRLAEVSSAVLCSGTVSTTALQTTLRDTLINFSALDEKAAPDLWASRPLLGSPRPGALRLPCSDTDLASLRQAYEGSHMQPLVMSIRTRRRSNRSVPRSDAVAVLVLVDYPNFFHQMVTVVRFESISYHVTSHHTTPYHHTSISP